MFKISDKMRLCFTSTLAIVGGTIFFFTWWQLSKNKNKKLPKSWRKVGELSDLLFFPVKSFGSIRENLLECTKLGLKSYWLRDRSLMVVDLNNKFQTLRQYPRMIHVIFKLKLKKQKTSSIFR